MGQITMHIMREKLGLDERRLSGILRIWITVRVEISRVLVDFGFDG